MRVRVPSNTAPLAIVSTFVSAKASVVALVKLISTQTVVLSEEKKLPGSARDHSVLPD